MTTINDISQLQLERKKLLVRQEELEHKIQANWQNIKGSLRPNTFLKLAAVKLIEMGTQNNLYRDGVVNSTVMFGTSVILKKIISLASKKILSFFSKKN